VQSIGPKLAGLLFAALVFSGTLHSQALPTEQKSADLQVGGGFSYVKPDYGSGYFLGPSVYGDFDFFHHLGVEVDIHLADYHAPNSFAENTYEIGARYNWRPRFANSRFDVYPKALYGRGVFNNVFPGNPQQYNEAYNIFSFGGGADFNYKRHINIRVVDFEYQDWLAFPFGGTNNNNHGLSPYVITVGAAYHF
jgi:hypothetical protein